MSCHLIPFALPLQPALPTIEGNVDYRQWRDQLQHIDSLLLQSGVETQFLQSSLQGGPTIRSASRERIESKGALIFPHRPRQRGSLPE